MGRNYRFSTAAGRHLAENPLSAVRNYRLRLAREADPWQPRVSRDDHYALVAAGDRVLVGGEFRMAHAAGER